jgi:hypothetical protein
MGLMGFMKFLMSGIRFAISVRPRFSFRRICLPILVFGCSLCCLYAQGAVELELSHISVPGLDPGYVPVAPGAYVFRKSSEWKAFWAAHPGLDGALAGQAPPSVDFSRFAVAGVFAGTRPKLKPESPS